MKKNTTPVSDAISQISFVGNITPAIWYQKIKRKAKKTKHGTISQTADLLAIAILSDIIYWYRNIEVRDEKTGIIIEIKKKFASDKLQKSYQSYADFFGVTKDDATDAVTNLVTLGLIKREYRTLIISGVPHNNVVFLSPVPAEILKLTHSIEGEGIGQLTPPYTSIEGEGIGQLTGTNTEITPKTTPERNTYTPAPGKTEIIKTISHIDRPLPKTDIDLKNKILAFLNAENDISEESRRAIFEKIARRRISIPGGLTLPETLAELADWWACRHFAKNRDLNMNYAGFIAAFKTDLDYYNSVQPDEKKQFPQTQKNGQQKTSGSTIRTQYDEEGNVIPRTKTATI